MSISVESMSISSSAPQPPPPFTPQEDWTLISQGAEARIWKIPSFTATPMNSTDSNTLHKNKKRKGADESSMSVASEEVEESPATAIATSSTKIAVAKERFTKSYRHAILDERLTKHRCRAEARILEKCLKKGHMDVPKVYQIQGPVLYLEFIEGMTVRDYLLSLHTDNKDNEKEYAEDMARHIGTTVGKLHSLGVVHGDLTTSNMMIREANLDISHTPGDGRIIRDLTLIDFGLGKNTTSAEEQAVDLYVLERALLSTHPTLPETFWDVVMAAYEQAASAKADNKKGCQATLTRLELVRQRGRKRECFG
jgi:TP53 regulating kinase-like protein